MRKIVIVLMGACRPFEEQSVLMNRPLLHRLASRGEVSVLAQEEKFDTPELAFLGVDPKSQSIAQGVLTASSFRIDPPSRSVNFHLSLGTREESGNLNFAPPVPTAAEERDLEVLVSKLVTPILVPKWGSRLDHLLVWINGSLDCGTMAPVSAQNQACDSNLPEGDGERILRRLIDDSVNLLSDAEINRRRIGEGIPPLNVLWPWGQGMFSSYTNLAVLRGETVHFESRYLRLQGLTRLFGYSHGDRRDFGPALVPNFARLKKVVQSQRSVVVLFDHIDVALASERTEESMRMLEEIEKELLEEIATSRATKLTVVATSSDHQGLVLSYDSELVQTGSLPFDERVLDDRRAQKTQLWRAVQRGLSS